MTKNQFVEFFKIATGRDPYPYQRSFAEDGELPDLLNVPTGVGNPPLHKLNFSPSYTA
jgi:hypothetical protein